MASFRVHLASDDERFSDCTVRGMPIMERRKNPVSRWTPKRLAFSSVKLISEQTDSAGLAVLGIGSSSVGFVVDFVLSVGWNNALMISSPSK